MSLYLIYLLFIAYSDCNEDDITSCRGKNADCRVVHGKFNCYCPKGFRSNINESCEGRV